MIVLSLVTEDAVEMYYILNSNLSIFISSSLSITSTVSPVILYNAEAGPERGQGVRLNPHHVLF